MNKKLITIIAGTVAVIIIVIAIATGASGNTSVKVSDYVELTLSGYSGYTSIPSHITEFLDEESLENEIISKDGTIENWQFTNGGYLYDKEVMFVTVEETESEYLSNGDTIKYTITINEDRFEALTGLQLKGKTEIKGKYKVSGLKEPELIDVFENLEFSFDGDNGNGYLRINKSSDDEFIKDVRINVSEEYKDYDLRNGEKIEIIASCSEYVVKEHGKAPKETSKTLTVSGLTEYATLDKLPKDMFINFANTFAEEYQKDNVSNSMFKYSDTEIEGVYFAESLDGDQSENEVHIVVHYTQYYEDEVRPRYHIRIYKNLVLNDINELEIKYEDGRGTYFFYESPEEYFNNLKDNYKFTKIN